MADERLQEVVRLLERHYGRIDLDTYRTGWKGLVRFVLERGISSKKFNKAWAALDESWLMSAEEVAQSTKSDLLELVQPHGISAEVVALLHRLAVWWQQEVDAGRTPFECGPGEVEAQWEVLAVRDVNWITRIFCVIGGLNRFPKSRGLWRIACRHRWLSWHDEGNEVLSFYESAARDQTFEPGHLAEWIIRTGEDYCGAKAKCAGCPLESLLGPDGPCEPDEGSV